MIRWLALSAAVVGLVLGIALPHPAAGHETGKELAVALTPPTLSNGSEPLLTCGWHTGCGISPSAGIALDWDDDNTGFGNEWRFRGFFYVSDTVRTAFKMHPLDHDSGNDRCDIMTVWIREKHSGALMAIPTYMHVDITNSAVFNWTGGPWTVYHTRTIGETIDDTGCNTTGSHVHEYHFDWLLDDVDMTRNTALYPTAASCSTSCGTFKNNDINKWTNRFAWDEGVASH